MKPHQHVCGKEERKERAANWPRPVLTKLYEEPATVGSRDPQ